MRTVLRRVILPIILTGLCTAGGCESTTPGSAHMLIRTPLASYGIDDNIRLDVSSLTGSPAYYICNGRIRMQRVESGEIRATWEVHRFDTCGDKRSILLGEVISFTILSRELKSVADDPAFVSGGEYRFQVDLYRDSGCTKLLERESDRLSNTVVITR